MATLAYRYIDYYTPLVQDFVRAASALEHPDVPGLPEPFLPAYGPQYEKSAMRLAIIGQDTRGWGDIRKFLEAEKREPGCKARETITTGSRSKAPQRETTVRSISPSPSANQTLNTPTPSSKHIK